MTHDPVQSVAPRPVPWARTPLVAAAIVGLAALALAACGRDRPPRDENVAPETATEILSPAGRPELPARGPGLASLPVLPESQGELAVLDTQPSDGAIDLPTDADELRIAVRFNRPVTPLGSIGPDATAPDPLSISPPVDGSGGWLDTSTYVFEPEEDLRGATEYTVSVDDGTTFTFTTAPPRVLTTMPASGESDAAPSRAISVTFSQAMDADSVARSFRLEANATGEPVPGRLSWDGKTALYTPRAPLAHGQAYVATIGADATSADGAPLAGDFAWRFETAPRPRVVRTLPRDGETDSTRMRGADLEIDFNTPMRTDGLTVTLQPTITHQSVWWDHDGRTAHVSGGWLASQAYTATIPADTASAAGEALGGDVVVRFSLAPREPTAWLRTPDRFGVHAADKPQRVFLDAVNVPRVELALYELGLDDVLDVTVSESSWSRWTELQPAEDRLVRRWSVDTSADVDVTRRVSTTLATDAGKSLAPGIYLLQTDRDERYVAAVSDLNLTLKHTPTEVLVWATSLATGSGVPGVRVAVYESPDRPLAEGVTDRDGILRASFPARANPWRPLVAVSVRGGRVAAVVGSDWGAGIDPWAFHLSYDPEPRRLNANVYTDRPIYRAGQTAYFRAVVRADDDAVYDLPAFDRLQVTVRDPQNETVLRTQLALGPFGTVHGEIPLSATARLGSYAIEIRPARSTEDAGPIAVASFRVAAYRKPEFEVEVETDRAEYVDGDTIQVTTTAAYYFGGPVADADVHWRLLVDDFFFRPDVEGWWDWIDYDLTEDRYYDAQGEVVAEGEGRLDERGRLAFELPADVSEYPLAQVFTIDVEITDLNHQVVAGRAGAVVHKSRLYVGLRPTEYVGEARQPLGFEVLALDTSGRPVAAADVDLAFSSRRWYSVREKREDGAFYWTSHYTDTLVSASTVTTDDRGRARASFTPRVGGIHRLVAEARDAAGRPARSATYAWVTDARFVNWRQEDNDRLALVSDKKSYEVGDTAEVLVPAPFERSTALLTIERGSIRDVRLLDLAGNSETLRIPIEPDYAPNVYVSVVLVKGVGPDSPAPQFKVGYVNLPVATDGKRIGLEISTDREGPYGPRDTVQYEIRATDPTGAPVRAELSLALVDKALLALTDDPSTPLEEAFYGQRGLAVSTAASLSKSADRLNQELAAEKKGGGGGLTEVGTVRRLFRDTAYWNGSVTTDEDGRARVAVRLPDNLTTWRLDARAVTAGSTLVGAETHEIVTTKPVLVRPVLPRFVVVGDALQLEAAVNNAAPEAVELAVTLTAVGFTLDGPASQPLTLPAGAKGKVVWPVVVDAPGLNAPRAPGAYGEAVVQMRAEGSGYEDTIELTLPAYPFAEADVSATAGQVASAAVTERIEVPADVIPDQGGLDVTLSPSLAAASLQSLDWLEAFPYDCSEQTTSKFLPNVATYEVLQADLPGDRSVEREAVAAQVGAGIQRLYALQNPDGGWGWWGAERSRAWLTAYALYGLSRARRAGFPVADEAIDRAASFLLDELDGRALSSADDADLRAFLVFVLSESADPGAGRAVAVDEQRDRLSPEGKAFLALALDATGPTQRPRIDGLLAEIGAAADASAGGTFWPASRRDPWSMGGDTRSTAVVILALARLDPRSLHLDPALRWLMAQRRGERWPTTQDTAWSLLALAEHLREGGEVDPDYAYHVELGGAELAKGRVSAADVGESRTASAPMSALAASAPTDLVLRRDGRGRLYYSAVLRAYRPAESLPPVDAGMALGRQYFEVDPTTFAPRGEAIDASALGDVVAVRLTLVLPEARHYVIVEDPLPAGFEIVDTSLKTTSAAARGPEFLEVTDEDPLEAPWWRRNWWTYWVESQLRDEKVALFATSLEAGTYQYTYLIRAGIAGHYHVIPARAQEMYRPEIYGRSSGGLFTVTAAPSE